MALEAFNQAGKTAIVTGGGRGIGEGIALKHAGAGTDIVLAARTKEQLDQAADKVRKLVRKCLAIPAEINYLIRSGFKTPSEAQWLCCGPPRSSRLRRDCAFSIGPRLALEPDLKF